MSDDFSFAIDLTPPDRRSRLIAAAHAAASWVRARRAAWAGDSAPPVAPATAGPKPVQKAAPASKPKPAGDGAPARGVWTGRER